jgi:hypothetical protein
MKQRLFLRNNEMNWYLALFIIASLGGAVRKWGTTNSGISNVILGIQMVIPFLMVYFRSRNCYTPFRYYRILYLYFFYLAFHVIYPLQLTPWHGVFGILVHGGFWLGIFYYFSNRHLFNPAQCMKWFLAIAILEVILAIVQYQLPATHILNKYASDKIDVAVVGDRVRVTGTFSFLSGYTAYMMFYSLMLWAMARLRFPQWAVFTAVIAGLSASFMTGSRSILVIYILIVGAMLIREYPVSTLFSVAGRLIIPAMIIGSVLLVVKKVQVFEEVEKAYDNFMMRVEQNRQSGEERSRLVGDLYYLQDARYKYPVFGVGLGSTYQGATQLFGTSRYVQEFGYAESEISRVLLEGGWTLILLKFVLGIYMALKLSFKGFMRFVVWFVVAVGQPIVYNPHNATFLLLGIMLVDNIIWRQNLAREIKRREQKQSREQKKEELAILYS